MTKKTEIFSYILLDRSGSMGGNWTETIGAVNAYVDGLAGEKVTAASKVTVAAFDNAEPFKIIRDDVVADKWAANKITPTEVTPRGMTPLYDAIGKLVAKVNAASPKRATIVIVTDGAENASLEVRKEAAKSMLDDMRTKGFDVVFIGANFDAFGQGASLGNAAGQTLNMTAGSYGATMSGLAMRTASYASTGAVKGFTDEDRRKAAGRK